MGPFMILGLLLPSWNFEGENVPNSNHSNHPPTPIVENLE